MRTSLVKIRLDYATVGSDWTTLFLTPEQYFESWNNEGDIETALERFDSALPAGSVTTTITSY